MICPHPRLTFPTRFIGSSVAKAGLISIQPRTFQNVPNVAHAFRLGLDMDRRDPLRFGAVGRVRNVRRSRRMVLPGDSQAGAALVEFAVLAPLLLLMLGGIVDMGLAIVNNLQLVRVVNTCTELHEDACADHLAGVFGPAASLDCYQATDPHCYPDGLTTEDRVTVCASLVHDSLILWDLPISECSTGLKTPSTTTTT